MPIRVTRCPRVAGKLTSGHGLFISVLIFLGVAVLADGREDSKFSAGAERKATSLTRQVRGEINQIKNHEWAGEYYAGDGLGVNTSLVIAPKHGYVFEWHGCMGLYDRNYGSVVATNGRIQLSFTFTNTHEGFEGIADEFIPIPWGERTYLVPTADIGGFCNEVNSGSEPRKDSHGMHLLRRGDEKKRATGNPALPAEYRSYLFEQPIKATVTKIGRISTRPSRADFKFKDTVVTINAGTNEGFRTGTELYVISPANLVKTVKLINVRDTESDGVITQIGDNEPAPKVGWQLSTRAPWR